MDYWNKWGGKLANRKPYHLQKKSEMTDSWTKTVQKKKIKSDKRITPNYKPRNNCKCDYNWQSQPSTLNVTPSTTSIADLSSTQGEVKQKFNTKNDILVGLYQKRDLGQLSQSDHKEITSREAMLWKYKADLTQKEAACKRQ